MMGLVRKDTSKAGKIVLYVLDKTSSLYESMMRILNYTLIQISQYYKYVWYYVYNYIPPSSILRVYTIYILYILY